MKGRKTDLVALGFLAIAPVLLVIFHTQLVWRWEPYPGGVYQERGWEVWSMMMPGIRKFDLSDPLLAMLTVGFLTICFLSLALPFLARILTRSRLAWWMVTSILCMAIVGTLGVIFYREAEQSSDGGFLFGFWCGVAAPVAMLFGLFLIRSEKDPGQMTRHQGSDRPPGAS